jgi:hypothetical protein
MSNAASIRCLQGDRWISRSAQRSRQPRFPAPNHRQNKTSHHTVERGWIFQRRRNTDDVRRFRYSVLSNASACSKSCIRALTQSSS